MLLQYRLLVKHVFNVSVILIKDTLQATSPIHSSMLFLLTKHCGSGRHTITIAFYSVTDQDDGHIEHTFHGTVKPLLLQTVC